MFTCGVSRSGDAGIYTIDELFNKASTQVWRDT